MFKTFALAALLAMTQAVELEAAAKAEVETAVEVKTETALETSAEAETEADCPACGNDACACRHGYGSICG